MTVQASYVPLRGGLDLVTPQGAVNPGAASDMRNFEVSVTGGYRRVDGYERFDGQSAPHLGNPVEYVQRKDMIDAGMSQGEAGEYPTFVRGERLVSPAVLRIPLQGIDLNDGQSFDYEYQFALYVNDNPVAHYLLGTFPTQASLLAAIVELGGIASAEVDAGELVITTVIEPVEGGDPSIALQTLQMQDHAALADTEESRREAIQALPGEGPVRGVAVFLGKVIAARDNGPESFLYVETPEGWSGITLPASRLAGGSYRFVTANFTGNPGDEALYVVDGMNPMLEIKGELMVTTEITDCSVTIGELTLYPFLVEFHKNHLFVAYPAGSLQHSGIGDPLEWTTTGGAGEIAIGQPIRELKQLKGDALGIFTEESVRVLYGNSSVDWQVDTVSQALDGVGAMPNTVQVLGQPIFADFFGVRGLSAVETYGNFAMSTATALVKPLFDQMRTGIRGSAIFRELNQYRLFADGGDTLILTSDGQQMLGVGFAKYGFEASCSAQGERADGTEIVVVGADDGYVYHMNQGNSFDGEPIEAALQLHFNSLKSPRQRKRFRKAVFEIDTPAAFDMRANLLFDYAGYDQAQHIEEVADITGNLGLWGVDDWGTFKWGGQYLSEGEIDITGSGRALSVLLYTTSADTPPFELNGMTLHYSPRRLVR